MKDRLKNFAALAAIVAGAYLVVMFIRLFAWACYAAGIPM